MKKMNRSKQREQRTSLKSDQAALDDRAFRQARFEVHIKQREWHAMSKKTKRALVAMFAAVARAHNSGKLKF